jgi:predicted enzyme related to lactoylglutathione lyase
MARMGGSLLMFRKVDCVILHVPDLNEGLGFYRDRLGLRQAWIRTGKSAGLRMRDSVTELVLVQEPGTPETDLLVDSADEACQEFVKAGGSVVQHPFDIPVGRCAIVQDPWGNDLVLLDLSKGLLKTDSDGNVIEP